MKQFVFGGFCRRSEGTSKTGNNDRTIKILIENIY